MAISETPTALLHRTGHKAALTAALLSGLFNPQIQGLEPALVEVLNHNIAQAQTILTELDDLAAPCLQANITARQTDQSCLAFLAALSGTTLQNYLQHCATLKNWRETLIESNLAANPAADDDPGLTLNLLLQVESVCGEQALIRRTEFVYDAYVALGVNSLPGNGNSPSLSRELRELRQEGLMERERQRLLNGLDDQQYRRQQEIQRQFDQQNLELLRPQQGN